MSEKNDPKKPTGFVIAATVGSLISALAVLQYFSGASGSVDSTVVAICADLNKSLPALVDRETRCDTTAAAPNRKLIYRYTLVNLQASAVDSRKFADALRPTLVANYRTNPQMASFREMGLTLIYQYSDRSGVFVTEITVHPEDLKEEKPNQTLEPTPTAGTSAAEQPLVPAAVVAHL